MPIIENKDWSREVLPWCMWYCVSKSDSKTCWIWCKNKKNIDMRKLWQKVLDGVEKNLY